MTARVTIACCVLARNSIGKYGLVKTPLRGWELPGGFVEKGESFLACIIRETHEESDLELKNIHFIGSSFRISPNPHIVQVFCADAFGEIKHGSECIDSGWFSATELQNLITMPPIRQRVKLALRGVSFFFSYVLDPYHQVEP